MLKEFHIKILSTAIENVLGKAEPGSMAYVRCLAPEVVEALATASAFAPRGWRVYRVADVPNASERAISADQAVELRESKGQATLLLVDTKRAGAGMDGIYSAAREVDEQSLFGEACRLAAKAITERCSRPAREQADQALRLARRRNYYATVPPWAQFDYLIRVAAERCSPGAKLHLLALWPVAEQEGGRGDWGTSLDLSRLLVERLLLRRASGSLETGLAGMRIAFRDAEQRAELERFLRSAATQSLFDALAELDSHPRLWLHTLQVARPTLEIQQIDLVSWRTLGGGLTNWSGLHRDADPESPPLFVLPLNPEATREPVKLEVRWKAQPPGLPRDAVSYRVSILTDMDEELATKIVVHRGGRHQSCKFFADDFPNLDEDASIPARVIVSVVDNEAVEAAESEDFVVLRGETLERDTGRVATRVRTFSEGLIEAGTREAVSNFVSAVSAQRPLEANDKSFLVCRVADLRKNFQVFRPPLFAVVEEQWSRSNGVGGRWVVHTRSSGILAAEPEFVAAQCPTGVAEQDWERLASASRKMAERFRAFGGGAGQIYDQEASGFDPVVKEYLLAWARVLESGEPSLALAHTIEVRSLAGRTIGLVVLPSHPLRVAWHVAYDNLIFHVRFREGAAPGAIREEFTFLDGAMFPAFLPGLQPNHTFVFADTLGFHAVAMVPDDHPEPKAAVALLAQALGGAQSHELAPTVGDQTVALLAGQIQKYIESHRLGQVVRVHALRPGDGRTVVRALGKVTRSSLPPEVDEDVEEAPRRDTAFVLELYPSTGQRHIVGRFIAEVLEKRRRAAGVVAAEDRWMLDSIALPHGINLPRLRWAKKDDGSPKSSAHLALVFDLFRPRVVPAVEEDPPEPEPLYVYGLCSFFRRRYTGQPVPTWRTIVVPGSDGQKHPANSTHTERLIRLQQLVLRCVAQHLRANAALPELRCELGAKEQEILEELHRQCDWVVTLDRNAGIEYFDAPRDHHGVYDAHVISCVPERGHLGLLQLMTSTANFSEVRERLDRVLAQMDLPQSRRNAEFLLLALKELSGSLAIRLTGKEGIEAKSIALALGYTHCRDAANQSDCWVSLDKGFFIPLHEVTDFLVPLLDATFAEGQQAADLLYVTSTPRRGLCFRFITTDYRRHRRGAMTADFLSALVERMELLRRLWLHWLTAQDAPPTFIALRYANLAQILRFYAARAVRHSLREESYRGVLAEIDRMIRNGPDYGMEAALGPSLGWIFCPEVQTTEPEAVLSRKDEAQAFLFGPHGLPDTPSLAWEPDQICWSEDSAVTAFPGGANSYQEEPERLDAPADACADGGTASSFDSPQPVAQPAPEPPLSIRLALGTHSLTGRPVGWELGIAGNPHLLVAGLPGMGKTTVLVNLCRQMVRLGTFPIVFSYHPDIDAYLEQLIGKVRYIDFGGLGFHPLSVRDRANPHAHLDVAGTLRDIFVAIFPDLGDLQGQMIRQAVRQSFTELGWDNPQADRSALELPSFGRFFEILSTQQQPGRGLHGVLARLQELADYGLFRDCPKWEPLWETDCVTVVRIHRTQNDFLQRAFASLVFYWLYKEMFGRGVQSRITHAVVFDEAHRAARLRLIPTMAKECRKFGLSLVLASQETRDFHRSLFSTIANYLVLRLNDSDAKTLVKNIAPSGEESSLVDKIKQLDRFQAFYFCEAARRPVPVSLPKPEPSLVVQAPASPTTGLL